MLKKLLSIVVSSVMLLAVSPINSFAEIGSNDDSSLVSEKIIENDSIGDPVSAVVANQKTVNDIIAQSKFRASQGHGFAAERGNNLVDQLHGRNASVVGDNNVKDGADRVISYRNGTTTLIQDKYYQTASKGVDACFNENGKGSFRYLDADGNPMQIEVPRDQYDDAIQCMQNKIKEGQIPGVTDPKEAKNIVRKGALTYKQAQNLAKAGTIESLTYDAINGTITATFAFGISTAINYAVHRLNGQKPEDAIKQSVQESLKAGTLVFCSSVITSQLAKAGVMDVFIPSSEALVSTFGKDFAKAVVNSTGKQVAVTNLTKSAASILRSNALTAAVTLVVFSVPDAIDLFNGRISQKQFVKNFSVMAIIVFAGTAGSIAGGAAGAVLVPGVGTIPGSIIGGILAGGLASVAASLIANYITDDDADEMYKIIQELFVMKCDEYLINEKEAENIVEQLKNTLTEDCFKDMYKNENREEFADQLLTPLFESEVSNREIIKAPDENKIRSELKASMADVAFIH